MTDKEEWIKKTVETTDPVTKEVNRILASPDPAIEVAQHLDNIIAGENENKTAIFELLISGIRKDPKKKVIIILKGTEGGGKSTLLKIADHFNTKDVGRFSEHALDYADLSTYEVLRLKEIGSMDEEKQGVSTLKFLSSDDKGYTVEITIREKETGEFTTKEYRIPPITLITSTTKVILDPQFERRAWIFNPDESADQTERIKDWKAKRAFQDYEVKLGLRSETDEDRSFKVLKRLVESLDDCEVVVPFPKTLFSIFDSQTLRVRGDYDKLLTLIENDGVLLQGVLPSAVFKGKRVVFTTPERTIQVLERLKDPLASMLLELEQRSRQLINILEKIKVTEKGSAIDRDKRNEIARELGRSEKTARRYLDEWDDSGYLSSDNRKPKTYTLLYDLDEIKRKSAGISDKLKLSKELILKMGEEARDWLRWQLDNRTSGDVSQLTKVLSYYPSPEASLSNVDLSLNQAPLPEISSNNWTNSKRPTMSNDSNPLDSPEKRQAILNAIDSLEKDFGYAQIAMLAYELRNRIPEDELKRVSESLQKQGLIFEVKPDCFKLTRG